MEHPLVCAQHGGYQKNELMFLFLRKHRFDINAMEIFILKDCVFPLLFDFFFLHFNFF